MGVLLAAVGYFAYLGYGLLTVDLDNELAYVSQQLEFGPRTTDSDASVAMGDWLTGELMERGWDNVLIQPYGVLVPAISARQAITPSTSEAPSNLSMVQLMGQNIITIREPANSDRNAPAPVAILVAPYDSRVFAGADPTVARRTEPSPGASVGASGVAVLLGLADELTDTGYTVCLAFLDSEANRGIPGWQPPFGGHHFVEQLTNQLSRCTDPRFAVVVDAVGAIDQHLQIDSGSDPQLSAAIWQAAADLGFGDQFVNEVAPARAGPHNTFIEYGIPTVLITDQNYLYRNTTLDTLDKLSAKSLRSVRLTLESWLEQGAPFAEN